MFRLAVNRYREVFSGLSRELWVLALVMFVNRSGAMVLAYLALYLTTQIGMSERSAGQMIGVFGVGSIAGSYLGGRLVEYVGAARLQTLCMLLAVPGYWLLPRWSDPWAIMLNVFLLALATEAVRPANATVITKVAGPELRARAFALQRLAANLGFAFGGAVGGILAEIDFRLLFFVDGGTTLVAACILIAYFRFRRLPGEVPRPATATGVGPVNDRVFMAFLVLFGLSTLVFFQFISTYTLYLHDHYELSKRQIGYLFAVNTLVIVAVEMLLIDYAKRWPLVRTIGWGSFLSCLGFGLLPFGSSFAYAVFAILVMTLGEMLSMPLSAGYVANRAPAGGEGRYMGWWATCISIAFVLGPMLGGAVYEIWPEMVWYASLAIAVLVLVGFYVLPEAEHDSQRDLPTLDEVTAPDPGEMLAESASS